MVKRRAKVAKKIQTQFRETGEFAGGLECIVMEVNPEDGRITKMKAAIPDERLGKKGFLLEGEDWVTFEWDYWPN